MTPITYTYEVISVDQSARVMEVVYRADSRSPLHVGARLPYEGETLEQIIEMYAPTAYWREQELATLAVPVGSTGQKSEATAPQFTAEQLLEIERASMVLSFAQFMVGLVEQQWVSPEEGSAWLSGSALPATVEAALATIPETAEDGSMPRLRARARALRPSEVQRNNELLLLMASMRGASSEDLDNFFRRYAAI